MGPLVKQYQDKLINHLINGNLMQNVQNLSSPNSKMSQKNTDLKRKGRDLLETKKSYNSVY